MIHFLGTSVVKSASEPNILPHPLSSISFKHLFSSANFCPQSSIGDGFLVSGLLLQSEVCLIESAGGPAEHHHRRSSLSDNHMEPAGTQLTPEVELHHDSGNQWSFKCIVDVQWY